MTSVKSPSGTTSGTAASPYPTRYQSELQTAKQFDTYMQTSEDGPPPSQIMTDSFRMVAKYEIYRAHDPRPTLQIDQPGGGFPAYPTYAKTMAQLPGDLRAMVDTARGIMGPMSNNDENGYSIDVMANPATGAHYYGVYGYPGENPAGAVFGPSKSMIAEISDGDLNFNYDSKSKQWKF